MHVLIYVNIPNLLSALREHQDLEQKHYYHRVHGGYKEKLTYRMVNHIIIAVIFLVFYDFEISLSYEDSLSNIYQVLIDIPHTNNFHYYRQHQLFHLV